MAWDGRGAEVWYDGVESDDALRDAALNLVLNARDAGATHIFVRARTELDRATLTVEDDGPGIDEEALPHIFEPFFTTKAEGTGLGLSTVYGAAHRLGGQVTVETAPTGTRFRVDLPLDATLEGPVAYVDAMDAAGPRPLEEAAWAGQRALVIDDDERLRAVVAQLLELEGWAVQQASGTADLPADLEGLRLVVSDVALQGEDGRDVVAGVAALCPGATVLFMSGNPGSDWPDSIPLLHKPFGADALYEAIKDAVLGLGQTA